MKSSSAGSKKRGWTQRMQRGARIVAGLTLLTVAIWEFPRLVPSADAAAESYVVDPIDLDLVSVPSWFAGSMEAAWRDRLAELLPTSLRDDAAVAALAQRVGGSNGWIRSIDRVEKRYPNRLELELTLREPVAMVETTAGMVLVDGEEFVVAPIGEAAEYLRSHELPLIHASRPVGVCTCGERIPLRDLPLVQEGLRVAVELAPHRARLAAHQLNVDVIDTTVKARTEGLSSCDVELYTREGLPIEWGRSRAHSQLGALEPTAEVKVDRLVRSAATHPGLKGVSRVKLQFDELWVIEGDAPRLASGG